MYYAWKQIVYVKQWVKLKKACTLFTVLKRCGLIQLSAEDCKSVNLGSLKLK